MDEDKIKCQLRPLTEFGTVLPTWNPNKKKAGRYSCSRWSATPKKQYAILAYIDGDNFDLHLDQGLEEEQILEMCLKHLNTPPPRKKFGRRTPKPIYGSLSVLRAAYKRTPAGRSYFEVILTTNQRKNKNFWGNG
tara:strand:+ start:1284 stop:1688 length:405 start_codon:yes stop_codon:yes gene_type:complete